MFLKQKYFFANLQNFNTKFTKKIFLYFLFNTYEIYMDEIVARSQAKWTAQILELLSINH